MAELVSCIMPTYNRQKWAACAIRSFLGQTYEPKELIIIDDGDVSIRNLIPSTEDSIHYLRLAERATTGEKRNLACRIAAGDVICNWDDDDWSHPGRIAEQVSRLQMTGKMLTGYPSTLYWNEADGKFYRNPGPNPPLVSGTSQCYRKGFWFAHPYPDSSMGEDSKFAEVARKLGVLDTDGTGDWLVARAHSHSSCIMDFRRCALLPESKVPQGFLAEVELAHA